MVATSILSLRPIIFYSGFWLLVFLLNTGPDWHRYLSAREVLETAGTVTTLQFLVAWIATRYCVPCFLERGRIKAFAIALCLLLFSAAELNVLISYTYLEPAYPDSYGKYYQSLAHLSLIERLGLSSMIKYILFSKLPLYFFPAAVLMAVDFYRKQQSLLQLRSQKQAAELSALKSQLNPHFIFNTLNNIYALALMKSDRAADAVATLSGIFHYVLYHCNENYVALNDEVRMIKDYIALEQLRFGDRIILEFIHDTPVQTRVAPLIFLTLIENAFKHGVSQSLKVAQIRIQLRSCPEALSFIVSNSKPPEAVPGPTENENIGLKNLRQQLQLLYPGQHRLQLRETPTDYTVQLTLPIVP